MTYCTSGGRGTGFPVPRVLLLFVGGKGQCVSQNRQLTRQACKVVSEKGLQRQNF